jgi:hypothetical protein
LAKEGVRKKYASVWLRHCLLKGLVMGKKKPSVLPEEIGKSP